MAAITCSHPKFRHVEPLSSVLKLETRDVDVSGLAQAPLDGEFVACAGPGEAVDAISAFGDSLAGNAGSCKMVWGHHLRSDQQSTGRKRVPVIWRGGMDLKLSLYDSDDATVIAQGDLVYVAVATGPVNGSAAGQRLIAKIVPKGSAADGWVVGYVVKGAAAESKGVLADGTDGNAGGGTAEAITIRLYDQPQWLKAS